MNSGVCFTILMPTRNRPRFLRRAVNAILQQEHTNFELIIKDGSDRRQMGDNVADLVDDPRIIYIHSRDRTITQAVNMAARLAHGDIIHWANDDDVMEPGTLVHVADTIGDAQWSYGRAEVVDAKNVPQFGIGGGAWSMEAQLRQNLCPQPTVFWRRELAEQVGQFDESVDLASDYDMWIRFGQVADPLVMDTILARYTLHDGSISVKRIDEQNVHADKVRLKHANAAR